MVGWLAEVKVVDWKKLGLVRLAAGGEISVGCCWLHWPGQVNKLGPINLPAITIPAKQLQFAEPQATPASQQP